MSQIRMQAHGGGQKSEARYTLDDNLRLEIKQVRMLVFMQILDLTWFFFPRIRLASEAG